MRWPLYLSANAVSALVWALLVGVDAYLIGPSVADFVVYLGRVGAVVLASLAIFAVTAELLQRRQRGGTGTI